MQSALRAKKIVLSLRTVHQYIIALKGHLAKWHVQVLLTEAQMATRLEFVDDQVEPGTEVFKSVEN